MLEKPISALMLTLLAIAMVMACGGCESSLYHPRVKVHELPAYDLKNATYDDKDITVAIEPLPAEDMATRIPYYDYRIRLFNLTITNKTNQNLMLDWNRVYFLNKDGQPDGGFMLEGEYFVSRGNAKQPLLILANSTRSIKIFPNSLVYSDGGGWGQGATGRGTFGMYAIISIKGRDRDIKVTVDIGDSPEIDKGPLWK